MKKTDPGIYPLIRRAAGAIALSLLLICGVSQVSSGYSVLTHEEIVDLLWTDQIKPLLLQKYPGTSDDELRIAHGYAYGGCLIQDMGYYPFGRNRLLQRPGSLRPQRRFRRSAGERCERVRASRRSPPPPPPPPPLPTTRRLTGHPVVNAAVAQEFPKLGANTAAASPSRRIQRPIFAPSSASTWFRLESNVTPRMLTTISLDFRSRNHFSNELSSRPTASSLKTFF